MTTGWPAARVPIVAGCTWLRFAPPARSPGKLGDNKTASSYDALFTKGQAAYIKNLWNGTYFNYDQGSTYHTDIMAEQLAGQWYANLTGLGDLVPAEMRRSALQRVYDYNVMKFQNGEMGALNGMGADGQALDENEQVEEVWVGTTFAVASHMLSEGMRDQAFQTARGVNNVVWRDRDISFALRKRTMQKECIAPACI